MTRRELSCWVGFGAAIVTLPVWVFAIYKVNVTLLRWFGWLP